MKSKFIFLFFFMIFYGNLYADNSTSKVNTPRIPQFPTVQTSSNWHNDNSLRLGYFNLNLSNIQPIVYYYECPEGDTVRSDQTSACNAAKHPFGGIDDTIKGKHCFQYRCDETSIKEPDDKVYHCEYENDGEWQ